MKKIYIIVLISCSLSLFSCGEWLNVKPETEIAKDDMFNTQNGFRDALIGAYIRLTEPQLYGSEVSWGPLEYFAQNWEYSAESNGERLSMFQHTETSGQLGQIFNQEYKVIADLNSFLEIIDEKKSIFDHSYYELIKGEALAMRALCHLDILRLFGPMPMDVTDKEILPYVKTVSRLSHDYYNYKDFTKLLLEDLDAAEVLLAEVDPILGKTEVDGFWAKRQIRINYYAVKALKARYWLWVGNKEKAAECARTVINAELKGEKLFRLGIGNDFRVRDYTLSCEHIFGIYVTNLRTRFDDTFMSNPKYYQNENKVRDELYGTNAPTDIRHKLWTTITFNSRSYFINSKYNQDTEKVTDPKFNLIPMIRLSELYFILMESSDDYTEVNALYAEFCDTRKIPEQEITQESQLMLILKDEYHKEFTAEGQTFYAYKRMGAKNILWYRGVMTAAEYVIPLPEQEMNYGKK